MPAAALDRLFTIRTPAAFERQCMDVFRWQAAHCPVYRRYMELLGRPPSQVHESREIPFLPISFFKTRTVVSGVPDAAAQAVFTSSGTTGAQPSRHCVRDLRLYDRSLTDGFTRVYGPPDGYTILALTPDRGERPDSSLVYMIERLMQQSRRPDAGFFMRRFDALDHTLRDLRRRRRRALLIGLTYALLDFAEQRPVDFPSLIVMETGGMKGTRDELPFDERRRRLRRGFGSDHIHAEYGMTELLSQAYSTGDGRLRTPPWMQVRIRDRYDPFVPAPAGAPGGVNVIDLANYYSCAFIETQDLGRQADDGSFEIVGRLEQADLRGCNLMYGER